mmetsp:Transcript_88453/g.235241  ORF Transcript_88453/g.235241 Transcript_88453/m.235241 type:complete len:248 (+) Transcript_88453:4123-4866(+)
MPLACPTRSSSASTPRSLARGRSTWTASRTRRRTGRKSRRKGRLPRSRWSRACAPTTRRAGAGTSCGMHRLSRATPGARARRTTTTTMEAAPRAQARRQREARPSARATTNCARAPPRTRACRTRSRHRGQSPDRNPTWTRLLGLRPSQRGRGRVKGTAGTGGKSGGSSGRPRRAAAAATARRRANGAARRRRRASTPSPRTKGRKAEASRPESVVTGERFVATVGMGLQAAMMTRATTMTMAAVGG